MIAILGKLRLYEAPSTHPPGAAMSSDWEVFASILLRDLGKKLAAGIDLSQHEVKSAVDGGSYEYQYHKKTGRKKLLGDMKVKHLFSITGITCRTSIFDTRTEAQ